MKSLLPIATSCLLIGGAVGYFTGQKGNSSASTENPAADSTKNPAAMTTRRPTSRGAGSNVATTGRVKTYEEIAAQPGQTSRLQALVELYAGLSTNEEFAAEADKINDLPFNERILSAYILFSAWAEVSPYDALAHADSSMGRAGAFVKPTILQSWAASDPKAAAKYYESNKSEFAMMGMMGGRGGGETSGAATIAGEWAKQDPDGALAWARSLDGRDSSQATLKILSQIASTDPQKAASLASGLEGGDLNRAYGSIAAEWAKKDWGAAESWINGLPADQKSEAMGSALRSLANDDPNLAASKITSLPEGEARDQAIETIAGSMARENPAKAAEWVVQNGSEEAQREAMRDVMGPWVNQDAAAAKSWAVSQPEGPVRDAAVASYVTNDTNGSPRENLALAETITDERSRGWAIGVTAFRWAGEDREAAMEYVQNSEFVDDRMKERMQNMGEGGGGFRRNR